MATAPPPAGDVATFRFSTNDYSERERLTAWREIFGRTVCNLDIEHGLAARRFRGIQALGCAAAAAKTRHRLHELKG